MSCTSTSRFLYAAASAYLHSGANSSFEFRNENENFNAIHKLYSKYESFPPINILWLLLIGCAARSNS